jgi:hypothetical protein
MKRLKKIVSSDIGFILLIGSAVCLLKYIGEEVKLPHEIVLLAPYVILVIALLNIAIFLLVALFLYLIFDTSMDAVAKKYPNNIFVKLGRLLYKPMVVYVVVAYISWHGWLLGHDSWKSSAFTFGVLLLICIAKRLFKLWKPKPEKAVWH